MSDRFDWVDDPEVTLLNGDPIPAEMEFPFDPPAEIGNVRAVYSRISEGSPLRRCVIRIAIIVLVFALCALPIPLFATNSGRVGHSFDPWIIGAILASLSIPLSFYFTRRGPGPNWVAYVGERGLVRYKLGWRKDIVKKVELLEFMNAADLYTFFGRKYENGRYTSTYYKFDWLDSHGKRVFRLAGVFGSEMNTPVEEDPYYIAVAGEAWWTALLCEAINIELEEQGAVHFKVNRKDWIRVGPGFIEFHFKGKTARLAVEDIRELKMDNGRFKIRSQDAGWFGGKGRYEFAYGRMANARLFTTCLEQLCGYQYENG